MITNSSTIAFISDDDTNHNSVEHITQIYNNDSYVSTTQEPIVYTINLKGLHKEEENQFDFSVDNFVSLLILYLSILHTCSYFSFQSCTIVHISVMKSAGFALLGLFWGEYDFSVAIHIHRPKKSKLLSDNLMVPLSIIFIQLINLTVLQPMNS